MRTVIWGVALATLVACGGERELDPVADPSGFLAIVGFAAHASAQVEWQRLD